MKKLAAALALSLLPLAFAAQAEITATDVVGRKVTVPDVPKRVVLGFYYEDYLAIAGPGSLDRVVGLSLTTWKDWRPKQFAAYEKALPKLKTLPDVGSTDDNTFSIEKLIATKPDLLILATFSYEALGESVKQIEAAGIPVLVLDYLSQTVDKHVASTLALGKIMGQEKRAQELADNYRKAFEDIDARIKKAGPTKKKVYFELAQKGASEDVTRERIAAYLKRPGWSNLPATKTGNVHGIYHGGARTLSDYVYAQYIAKQLYPEAFADVNPQQNLRDFYDKWLPVKADGVFMLPYGEQNGSK